MKQIILLLLLVTALPISSLARDTKGNFVVVIDPGHGGHDSGALGRKSKEKDIVLSVAKKVGAEVKAQNPNISVYYTRSTDSFVGLDRRAQFAINKHADLFVSIHANSTKGAKATGAETYVLGLHRSKENLEVAMKENSVILLEDNYDQKYEDFDPNSSESYIIFQFMQNKHLDASIRMAEMVQKGFRTLGRRDRGVRQAGFLVLRQTAMPSVLVELGFISNPSEESYMCSSDGQANLSNKIANAILSYEHALSLKNGHSSHPTYKKEKQRDRVAEPETSSKTKGKLSTYRIQILADTKLLPKGHFLYRKYGTKVVKYYHEGKYYKYTLYDTSDLKEAHAHLKNLRKRFKDCFIVGFDENGEKIGAYY